MLQVKASVDIDRPPDVILDWISDLDRYQRADRKIARVLLQEAERVRYHGRLRGIPTPIDEQTVHRDGSSPPFRGAPRWTRRLLDFEGGFQLTPSTSGGTTSRTSKCSTSSWPVRWLAEAWLRSWLQADIEQEMGRLKQFVEAEK